VDEQVGAMRVAVDGLLSDRLERCSAAEVLQLARDLETQVRRLAAVQLRVVTALERVREARVSTASLLVSELRLAPAEAAARVSAARG
jgi:hypothetical protein